MLQLGWDRWKGPPRPGAPRSDRHCCASLLFPLLGRQFHEGRAQLGLAPLRVPGAALPVIGCGGCRYPVGTLYKVILTPFLTLCSISRAFASRWGWWFESVC